MPGPRMGPRPADFDEEGIRQSPTFIKWQNMSVGETLRYACRDFVKNENCSFNNDNDDGRIMYASVTDDEEERLMRRIMIARRNNLKDHDQLKKARKVRDEKIVVPKSKRKNTVVLQQQQQNSNSSKRLRNNDECLDMDVPAVEATRSYQSWKKLLNGSEFVYNQKYIKGKKGHDLLLRKNIWRRMRYRRENKELVHKFNVTKPTSSTTVLTAPAPVVDFAHIHADALDAAAKLAAVSGEIQESVDV